MTRRQVLPLAVLVVLLLGVVAAEYYGPKPLEWDTRLLPLETQPYDTYVLDALLPDFFQEQSVSRNRTTLYQLTDELAYEDNIFVLSSSLTTSKEELAALMDWADAGGHALIVAEYFDQEVLDYLNLRWNDDGVFAGIPATGKEILDSDSVLIYWHPGMDSVAFEYPVQQFSYSFELQKASGKQGDHYEGDRQVLAGNGLGKPVALRYQRGEGHVTFISLPLAFTNFFLLNYPNEDLVSHFLNELEGPGDVVWTEYYQRGTDEQLGPMGFIASESTLRWAYHIFIWGAVLFMLFQSKRRQRIIPVMKPPRNATLDFVKTIGTLYFERKNHPGMARKRALFWMDFVRRKYFLVANPLNEEFGTKLAHKAQKDLDETQKLVRLAQKALDKRILTKEELFQLNRSLEKFYR